MNITLCVEENNGTLTVCEQGCNQRVECNSVDQAVELVKLILMLVHNPGLHEKVRWLLELNSRQDNGSD